MSAARRLLVGTLIVTAAPELTTPDPNKTIFNAFFPTMLPTFHELPIIKF